MNTSFLSELQTLDQREIHARRPRPRITPRFGSRVKIYLLEQFIGFAYRVTGK